MLVRRDSSILQPSFCLLLSAVWILPVCTRVKVQDERGESEKSLVYDLFDKNGYNPLIRPVRNENDSLEIQFNLALSQIIHMDEVNQVMKTNVWLQVYWEDYQLQWKPNLYDNIDSIRIKPEKVWVPDFVLFNKNYRTPRTHSMPYWVRVVFLKELPKYLLMARPDHDNRWQEAMTEAQSIPCTPETRRINLNISSDFELSEVQGARCHDVSAYRYGNTRNRHPSEHRPTPGGSLMEGTSHQDSEEQAEFVMTPELRNTVECVKFIYTHLKSEKEYEIILEDWKYVARVLDRLCLFIFLFVTLCGTASILLNAPHILEFVDQDKIIQELMEYIKEAELRAGE